MQILCTKTEPKQSFSVSSHTLSMNLISDSSNRRILSFPAVHPCESISPAALLGSLIPLCRHICSFQSRRFATQRRTIRATIRHVSILLMLFEDAYQCKSIIPHSVVVSFSDLHFVFQKIQFLLEDCAREDGRVFMLTKCEFLSSQFKLLIGALATTLDVLPLDSIDIDGEVKELLQLVLKQTRSPKLEIDPADKLAFRRLLAIMTQFEKGIEPDLNAIKRVLDYLQIKSWTECNMEIKFLEEEINFLESSDTEPQEVPFLSSLVGLMNYSRALIFETLDHQNSNQIDPICSMESYFTCLNPEDFRCPISLELMLDPVTVSTGQTYDRSSIQKWLQAGNDLCPKTGEMLTGTELVPNSLLRNLIKKICACNGISLGRSGKKSSDINQTIAPGSPVFAEAMKFLSRFLCLRVAWGTSEQKNKAAYEIRLLAKSNIFNRSCLIKAGVIPPLLQLLCSTDSSIQENSISALLKLSKYGSGKKLIMAWGGLASVLDVLKNGQSSKARQSAAATIFYLSSVKEYRKNIGENPEAIPALVELIKEGTACGKKNAVVAIFGLLLYPKNQQKVIEAGTVPLLIDTLATLALSPSENNDQVRNDTLAVLAILAENALGTFVILDATALHLILNCLQNSTSSTAREYCVSILLSLCNNAGEEVVAALAKDPSVMPTLFSLLTDGTCHAGKKARQLIKIMHNFHEASCSRWMASAVTGEQCVQER